MISLPTPRKDSEVSLEHTLAVRRTIRNIGPDPIPLSDLSQLLWAGQGITDEHGHRTAPSGYGVYPLELYVVAARVDGLESGAYRYHPREHALSPVPNGPEMDHLVALSGGQEVVKRAAVAVLIAGGVEKMEARVGARAIHSLNLEAGHVAQNILLQATALGLAATPAAGFDKAELDLPAGETLYMVLTGNKG
ncbi:SagB/ThcOx family dehydrogenase [bacterium]|nr:SagB/ThcOx family dehydrogenase [bacterium]